MKLHPLNENASTGYTTFGCMWKQGENTKDTEYVCTNKDGEKVELESRVSAYWPDGSVKWTAHTADSEKLGSEIEVLPGKGLSLKGIDIVRSTDKISILAGQLELIIDEKKNTFFEVAKRSGVEFLRCAKPVLILEKPVEVEGAKGFLKVRYEGRIDKVTLEHAGRLTTIVKYEGVHVAPNGEEKIPFIIRMEAGFNNPNLKFTHTFIYDGDENKDFLKGLGIEFKAPLSGPLYNRHVKFTGDAGVFHEAPVHLTSWRPRIPATLFEAQMRDEKVTPNPEEQKLIDKMFEDVPFWDTYDLCQDSVSHFCIKKKLEGDDLCYIEGLHGNRSKGGAAWSSEYGSVKMAMSDFWEKYPSGVTLKGLSTDEVTATMWFYSPEAPSFDFRHYARRGYNQVCYEGYDYKGADPDGIACTNECMVCFSDAFSVSDEELTDYAKMVNNPPVYVGTPEFYHSMRAFGYWSLPKYDTEMEKWLEGEMKKAFLFYKNEVEVRKWYGLFNYGDFMHTYDGVRHTWKYDTGGYAWDNTELVPTLWLWLYFMRTGREDVFRLAAKLSRHASEVDVYHVGKYKGLGSRHNVRHWGCPCKEARIAMAHHHRYYYYLTGDVRLEDIFDELKDNEYSFLNKDPLGDFFDKETMKMPSHARSGPDWSSLCSNWMTQWERFNDTKYRDKILVGLEDIKNTPLKLSSGPDFEFDPVSLHLGYIGERTTGGVHLQICMGAPSIWMEMADLLGDDELKDMISDYGHFYYLSHEEQLKVSNGIIKDRESTLPFMAASMAAYGAAYKYGHELARTTWRILLETLIHGDNTEGFKTYALKDTANEETLQEINWISTNYVAQFCLNAIMVLDFIRDDLPGTLKEAMELTKDSNDGAFRKA